MIYTASRLLDVVNNYLSELKYSRTPEELYKPIEYVLSLGGKRIRPVLMLMAYNLYQENIHAILPQAAGIETYHNYTLLHDDLMDRSDMRRGKPTVHKIWDENTAILSGDAMLVLAYKFMSQGGPSRLGEVMDLFGTTALEICEGQQFDMEFEHRGQVVEGEYIEMIRLKTAVLLAASLKIGAILGGASAQDSQALYDFGIQMGLAFQLKDDFLDVYGDPAVFGKNIGGDILCNKKTYLLIKALERADTSQQIELQDWLSRKEYDAKKKIQAVTDIYNKLGIKDVCENKMREYYAQGINSLLKVNVAEEKKQELKSFAEHLMYREM